MSSERQEFHSGIDPIQEIARLQSKLSEYESTMAHQQQLATLGSAAAMIAHEYNNIMTPVLAYAQSALRWPDDHELAKKALLKTVEGLTRGRRIADTILGLGQRDAAKQLMEVQEKEDASPKGGYLSAKDVVQRAVEATGIDWANEKIEVQIKVRDDCSIQVDVTSLQHVLLNLFLNARAAMLPSGGILAVDVFARGQSTDGASDAAPLSSTWNTFADVRGRDDSVYFIVTDTGKGMTPEQLRRIRQNRPQISRTRQGQVGVGLHVCERLLKEIGGDLEIRSKPGVGTSCIVRIPNKNHPLSAELDAIRR